MKAAVFVEPGRIVLDEKPVPDVGPLDALIRICVEAGEMLTNNFFLIANELQLPKWMV